MALQSLTIRAYRDDDEPAVLDLLRASLGGGPAGERPPVFFRWKHVENPFGRSFMLVAEAGGRLAGLRAFMRWRFRAGERTVLGVRAVDTATHPDFQGAGVFSTLTRSAIEQLREQADLIFNTPNDKSLPGYLKMGWRTVGQVPISIRVKHPVRFARGFRSAREAGGSSVPAAGAQTVGEALARGGVGRLLADLGADGRLQTPRDEAYLAWRYACAPLLDYLAVRADGPGGLDGLAIFRVRARGPLSEATIAEVLVRPGDVRTARRLLRAVGRSARVDHVATHVTPGTAVAQAARWCGFLRAPGGMTFVVNPLRDGVAPDPEDLRSWALALGDLEVF